MGSVQKIIKKNPCSTQLSMKYLLLINVKIPTIVSKKSGFLSLSETEKVDFLNIFYAQLIFYNPRSEICYSGKRSKP